MSGGVSAASTVRRVHAALKSAGRLASPYVELSYAAPPGTSDVSSVWAGLARWSQGRKDAYALRTATARLTSEGIAKPTELCTTLAAQYADVVAGITSGNWGAVKPLLTEGTYALARRGAAEAIAEYGSRQGAKIIQTLGPATIVAAELLYSQGALRARMSREKPDFAQVTVRHVTLQQPVASHVPREEGNASKRRAAASDGYTSESEEPTAPRSTGAAMGSGDDTGDWVPVEHRGTGMVYWFNSATGVRTWSMPRPSQLIPRTPFRIEVAGVERIPEAGLAGAAGPQYMRVVHHVVWERALREGSPAVWRIAKM